MTTASGTRDVPHPREEVWRALAVLEPYCAVCDVSYVVSGSAGQGASFVCVPGQLDGRTPSAGARTVSVSSWALAWKIAGIIL